MSIFSASTIEHVEVAVEFLLGRDPALAITVVAPDRKQLDQLERSGVIRLAKDRFQCRVLGGSSWRPLRDVRRFDASFLLYSLPGEGGATPKVRRRMGWLQRASSAWESVLIDGEGNAWDPTPAARLRRRWLRPLWLRWRPVAERTVAELVRSRALPDLGPADQIRKGTCRHAVVRRITEFPRPLYQCEECRVGMTPWDWMTGEQRARLYAHQYHARWIARRRRGGQGNLKQYQDRRLANMQSVGLPVEAWAGQRVLDFGCGTGGLAAALAERGATVTGCDRSPQGIGHARLLFPDIDFRVAGEDLEGVEGPFDLVVFSHVLEHVKDPEALLVRSRRLLSPGGHLYVEVPWADATTWAGDPEACRIPDHLWEFNKGSLARLLAGTGYEEVGIEDTCGSTGGQENYLTGSARNPAR